MVTVTKFLKLPEVQSRTRKSRSAIYEGAKNGTFPKQVKIGLRAIAWIESEIEAHNQACINASRSGDSE